MQCGVNGCSPFTPPCPFYPALPYPVLTVCRRLEDCLAKSWPWPSQTPHSCPWWQQCPPRPTVGNQASPAAPCLCPHPHFSAKSSILMLLDDGLHPIHLGDGLIHVLPVGWPLAAAVLLPLKLAWLHNFSKRHNWEQTKPWVIRAGCSCWCLQDIIHEIKIQVQVDPPHPVLVYIRARNPSWQGPAVSKMPMLETWLILHIV